MKFRMMLIFTILILLFSNIIITADPSGKTVITTKNNSIHPISFKVDDDFILFWEEIFSETNSDIFYIKLNREGFPSINNNKVNITNNNSKHQSYIISIVYAINKYYILCKTVGDRKYYYDIIIFDPEIKQIIRKQILDGNEERIPLDEPTFCYDGESFAFVYSKRVSGKILTTDLVLQKYDNEWSKIDSGISLIDNNMLKIQPNITFINDKYEIFYRGKEPKDIYHSIYSISFNKSGEILQPKLISIISASVFDYRINIDENSYFVLWVSSKHLYYKYVNGENTTTFRIPKWDKTNFISEIRKIGNSYFYVRVAEEYNSQKLFMDRICFSKIDFDNDISLSAFSTSPKHPFLTTTTEPDNDLYLFWSDKIDGIYQIQFRELNF